MPSHTELNAQKASAPLNTTKESLCPDETGLFISHIYRDCATHVREWNEAILGVSVVCQLGLDGHGSDGEVDNNSINYTNQAVKQR
jgi:hypothetical protein